MMIFMIDWNGSILRQAFSTKEKAQHAVEEMSLPQSEVQVFKVQVDA